MICRILNVQVSVKGKFPERTPDLTICNHYGVLDPFIIASQVPVTFAARSDLVNWPFLGWVCREMGLIFVERERPTQTGNFVEAIHQKRRHGVQVVVFPEGTTSGTHELLPFKTGSFATVESDPDAVILPILIRPTRINGEAVDIESRALVTWADNNQTFARHAWRLLGLRGVEIEMVVGEPEIVGDRNRKELARILHAKVSVLGTA